jgi:Ni,Fe-hydrogenase maturation factor
MEALVIAIGNTLRHDDHVAQAVVHLLPPDIPTRTVLQLTPEIAEEVAGYQVIVFVDADVDARTLRIDPVRASPRASSFTHVLRSAEIVALARSLFGFTGDAYICHIPVTDLTVGEGLSQGAREYATRAAHEITELLSQRSSSPLARSFSSPREHRLRDRG